MRYQVQVLRERNGDQYPGARRPVLIDAMTGLLHELATAFVYRDYPHSPYRTQLAALQDIAFFLEWCELKAKLAQAEWSAPERRVSSGQRPIEAREIADFCRWSTVSASRLSAEVVLDRKNVRSLPLGDPVEGATANRRMRAAARYLCWLTPELLSDHASGNQGHFDAVIEMTADVRMHFQKHEHATSNKMPIRSLDSRANSLLLKALRDAPSDSPHRRRDALIVRVLHSAGTRAGELLKLHCGDISDVLEATPEKLVGCIEVHLRPNDPLDDRTLEPAGKTLPRRIPVARSLATDLIRYITADRQDAVSHSGWEHPFLFVCHSGKRIGKPMSQRNLNRIVSAFAKSAELPQRLVPHILRHTHFDQLHDQIESQGKDPRAILQQRGGWGAKSGMPERYTQRSTTNQSAKYIAQRDRMVRGENN